MKWGNEMALFKSLTLDSNCRSEKQPNLQGSLAILRALLGAWDFEIMIEVQQQLQAAEICENLCQAFSADIAEVQTLAVLRQGTSQKLRHF